VPEDNFQKQHLKWEPLGVKNGIPSPLVAVNCASSFLSHIIFSLDTITFEYTQTRKQKKFKKKEFMINKII